VGSISLSEIERADEGEVCEVTLRCIKAAFKGKVIFRSISYSPTHLEKNWAFLEVRAGTFLASVEVPPGDGPCKPQKACSEKISWCFRYLCHPSAKTGSADAN